MGSVVVREVGPRGVGPVLPVADGAVGPVAVGTVVPVLVGAVGEEEAGPAWR